MHKLDQICLSVWGLVLYWLYNEQLWPLVITGYVATAYSGIATSATRAYQRDDAWFLHCVVSLMYNKLAGELQAPVCLLIHDSRDLAVHACWPA